MRKRKLFVSNFERRMRLLLLHLKRRKNHDFSVIEIFAGVWYGLVLETLVTLGNGTTTRSSKDE